MIAIAGPSKRIAYFCTCLAVILGVTAAFATLLVVTFISAVAFSTSTSTTQLEFSGLKAVLAITALVVLPLPLWVMFAVIAFIGRSFNSGGQSLSIQQKGMFFPCLPGLPKGRFVHWEKVNSIGLLDESGFNAVQKFYCALNRLLMPGHVALVISLNTRASDLLDTKTLIGKFYRINDLFAYTLIEPGSRQRAVVELLAVPISGECIVTLLRLLLQHEALRESFTATDAVRTVQTQDEIDRLLSELKSIAICPSANASLSS